MMYSNDGEVIFYKDLQTSTISKYIEDIKLIKTNKRIAYYNIPSAFDIETTSFYEGDEKRAIMYEWTFGINGLVIIGRYWDEFIELINNISSLLQTSLSQRLIVYIHNLAFEFQFICKRFSWDRIFATDERKPLYCITDYGIEFRCSYLLSGFSLAKVGEHLLKYKCKKMVGDLDYKLKRNGKTPLSQEELQYCINDVRIVMSYIQELIEQYDGIDKLPLTKTGFVRNFVRKKCFHRDIYGECYTPQNKNKRKHYNNLMAHLKMNIDTYPLARRCFMGGYTHASLLNSGKLFKNVHSYDFTSSYPYVMISNKFPMSEGKLTIINSMKDYEFYDFNYLCAFDVEFFNIECDKVYGDYIPISKCIEKQNYIDDNGKLLQADKITISLTNIDFDVIRKFYKWEHLRFSNFYYFEKEYLPKEIILAVLELYEKKTKLKNVVGFEKEYNDSKEMLNSCYGMCVTDIAKEQNNFVDGMWCKQYDDLQELLDKYNLSRNRFLFYWWGIFIPAYARRNLFYGIGELKTDLLYTDTDSLKFINYEKHKAFFDNYNKVVEEDLKYVMEKLDIPFEKCKPKTKDGIEKLIGVFDYEGMYDEFKTLGCKRYMYTKNGEISFTISGVNKKYGIPYLKETYKNNDEIFNHFTDNLVIPAYATGKQIHTYIDYEIKGILIDYLGNVDEYDELSSTHLEETEYSLSISETYKRLLFGIKEIKM